MSARGQTAGPGASRQTHAFMTSGTYAVVLTVMDDDGGSATASLVLAVGL